jgi:methionyl-tRNA synthetase
MLIDSAVGHLGSTDLESARVGTSSCCSPNSPSACAPWIDTKVGDWPTLATSIALKWLDEGLEDRGITRDLDWGIPVNPAPRFEGKVFYVWFDAPIGYIAATREWAELHPDAAARLGAWWRTDRGATTSTYTQFMAKDNVPFHTLSFPATLIGSGEPWKLVDQLKSFNWLNYYGGKFSTSDHRGVFMTDALELLPADYWRWYLLSNAPESDDTSFTWEQFAEAVNKDLVGTLGNFVNRCATQIDRHFDGAVCRGRRVGEIERRPGRTGRVRDRQYRTHFDGLEFRKAARGAAVHLGRGQRVPRGA